LSFYTPSQIFQPLNIIQCSDFVPNQNVKTSHDGSVSAVCYSLDNRGIVVHIPIEARDLFLVQSIQTSFGINKNFIFQEHQKCCAHGIKQLEHAADQSSPFTANVNSEWSYTSTPHINGMQWHDFTFTLTQDLKHCNLTVKNNSPQCPLSLKVTGLT
jgi:hypothetical protein